MEFRKFILYTIILISIVLLIDIFSGVCFTLIEKKAVERCPNRMITEFTIDKVDSNVIIIGSSRARHHYDTQILEDSLKKTVYNCGLDGNFFLYQNTIINCILDRYTPQIIIWDFEPISYFQRSLSSIESEKNRLSILFPFYYSKSCVKKTIDENIENSKFKMRFNLFRFNSRFISFVSRIVRKDNIGNGYAPVSNKGYNYPSLKKYKNNEVFSKERLQILENTITRCKRKNVKLIFSFSPSYRIDNYNESESYKAIKKLTEKEKIPLLDFFHDKRIINDSTNFKNSTHLNQQGAEIFTKLISSKIKIVLNKENS